MQKILHLVISALIVIGCDSENQPKKKESEMQGNATDLPSDKFEYIDSAEFALDTNAFLNSHTKENYQVGTLYFEGGTERNCAKWDVKIIGEGISLARGDRLLAVNQTRLNEDIEAGVLSGQLETRGAIPGIRFVVQRNSIVTFSGIQDYCRTTDKAEFNVQVVVEKSKLHEIFRGVEINGIGFMTLKFSDEKNVETVEKAKKTLTDPTATSVDPTTAEQANVDPATAVPSATDASTP